jgi:hypothetical protein
VTVTPTDSEAARAAQLVVGAPNISSGKDWGHRSLRSWEIAATQQEGLTVERTDDGGPGDKATWCGNVRVAGTVLRIHVERAGRYCPYATTLRTPFGVVGERWLPLGPPVEQCVSSPAVWAEVA